MIIQIIICILYTCFIAFDATIIILGPENNQKLFETADTVLEWLQAIYNIMILICYFVLFISFMMLIRQNEQRFGPLNTQIIAFFSIMLVLLITNFVLDIVFYVHFNPKSIDSKDTETILQMERLVSLTYYIHTILEILFNIVLLVFLISQAS